ncbi:MAG: hypothetical protein Q9204_005780 [Flavoplaca sp. TL-2023a]
MSSASSFLGRTRGGLSLAASDPRETVEVIGPLGLNALYEPPRPLIDFIFVHGLGGGSRKTWNKGGLDDSFWPKAWLPKDPSFENVRIHTFGYNATWNERSHSSLNLHDFGKALLGELWNTPVLKRYSTPLVLIGHSMGGLVMKKMYILARQDPALQSLSERISAMFFLATPHRGSDMAQLLGNILRASVTHSQKPFIADLERNGMACQIINDEFRHHANNLQLRTFYETMKTNVGPISSLIVNQDSATLGYHNEQSALLNANHRGMCKFESEKDPNYITLRNSLESIVRDLLPQISPEHSNELPGVDMKSIEELLGVSERPEDDITKAQDNRIPGSCAWLTSKPIFREWRDDFGSSMRALWLSAQPAAGKSILAGYIVDELGDLNLGCEYFFFQHGHKAKSTLSGCLRSLAYQMALTDTKVRETLMSFSEVNTRLNLDDESAIWRKLFLNGILRAGLGQTHYWILDAMDECTDNDFFFSMLSKIDADTPLRILFTSRPSADIEKTIAKSDGSTAAMRISVEDTTIDIDLYLNANLNHLAQGDEEMCDILKSNIIEKSDGCFLWVVLVLDELDKAYSASDIQQVLEEIPPGMNALYERTLSKMATMTRGKQLIQTILTWTMCAMRPLEVDELHAALEWDMEDKIHALERLLVSQCGHFVYIDKQRKVQAVHQTARVFLMREDLDSDFAIRRADGHLRLASTCLKYLMSEEMKPPRNQKLAKVALPKNQQSAFVTYASHAFSDHIRRSHSYEDDLMTGLTGFLESNVLSWINWVARDGDLTDLTHAAKDFRGFLDARAKYQAPVGRHVQLVENWSTDLIRLVAKFGKWMIESPQAIYWLIPPFCPKDTAIAKQFGASPRGISVSGLSTRSWDDRLSCISFHGVEAIAIGAADGLFAVGLATGTVIVYSEITCQEVTRFDHGGRVEIITFSGERKYIACGGRHSVTVWKLNTSVRVRHMNVPDGPLSLAFVECDTLAVVSKSNTMASWNILAEEDSRVHVRQNNFDDESMGFRRQLVAASFSLEMNMLAVVHHRRPISLFDLGYDSFYGCCERDIVKQGRAPNVTHAIELVFNPDPTTSLLAATYIDGALALFDPCELALKAFTYADSKTLACSPDGKALVTGNQLGTLRIYEFSSLRLLYQIISSDYSVRALAFSSDGLRFFDVRRSVCNAWEPSVLVRADSTETDSISDAILPVAESVDAGEWDDAVGIRAMVCHQHGAAFFCGLEDGSIAVYEVDSGKQVQVLYRHVRTPISCIAWGGKENILASADVSSRVMMWRVDPRKDRWECLSMLDTRVDGPVRQLLFDPQSTRLLVSTEKSDTIWSSNGELVGSKLFPSRLAWRWTQHPRIAQQLIMVTPTHANLYEWAHLNKVTRSQLGTLINSEVAGDMDVKSITSCSDGCELAIEFSERHGKYTTLGLAVWKTSDLQPHSESIYPLGRFETLRAKVDHVIGAVGRRLYYLDKSLWLCHVDLECFKGEYYRHFFLPEEWPSLDRKMLFDVTAEGVFLFVKRDEIAVIKRALEFEERCSLISGRPETLTMLLPSSSFSSTERRPLLTYRGRSQPQA